MQKFQRLWLSRAEIGCAYIALLISANPQCKSAPSLPSSYKQGEQFKRHRIEQMFGKYFGSYKNFDIYGVAKSDGSWDREDDSSVSGIIVAPEGSKYTHIELKAELQFRPDWLYGKEPASKDKHKTESIKTSTSGDAWDNNPLNVAPGGCKPQYQQICHAEFKWECPRSVDIATLRITDLVAH